MAFKIWMVAGPEQARLLTEFESQFMDSEEENYEQHEQVLASQELFQKHTSSLHETMSSMEKMDDRMERNIKYKNKQLKKPLNLDQQ